MIFGAWDIFTIRYFDPLTEIMLFMLRSILFLSDISIAILNFFHPLKKKKKGKKRENACNGNEMSHAWARGSEWGKLHVFEVAASPAWPQKPQGLPGAYSPADSQLLPQVWRVVRCVGKEALTQKCGNLTLWSPLWWTGRTAGAAGLHLKVNEEVSSVPF